MAKMDKIWMETTRTRAANGISTWEVEMSQKFLERVAEQNNGLTYRNEEKFEVSMKVKDGSSGYIKHVDTGKVVNYLAKVFKPAEDKVQVDFLVNQTDTFSYPFAATFRGYTTGAFYRFFNHIIRNRPDYFATVTMDIAKKEEDEATEEKAIEQSETQAESTEMVVTTPEETTDETATAQSEVVEEVKVEEKPKKSAKKPSKKAKNTDIEAEIPVVKPDVITEDVLEEPTANAEATVAEEIVHEAPGTDPVASSEANDVVTIAEAVSEEKVKEEKSTKNGRKSRSKNKEIEEVDLDKLLEEVDAAN